MQPIPASKRILHREKVDGKTLAFSLERLDESLAAAQNAIPFDNPTAFKDWIKRKLDAGELSCISLRLDDKVIGSLTYAVVGDVKKELLLTHCHIADNSFGYCPLLKTFAVRVMELEKCDTVRFHTVRKGLIKTAIALGFHVSEIVLRLTK